MSNRENYIDYLKTTAILMVLVYHSCIVQSAMGCALLSCCVPLFFFVNGYLMLKKTRSEKDILLKVIKMFFLFWLWGSVSTICQQFVSSESVSALSVVKHVYNSDFGYVTHLWFLQTLIILYLIYPLLQSYLREISSTKLFYFIVFLGLCCVQFVCVFMRKINPVSGWHGYSLLYFVIGYAVLSVWNSRMKKISCCWYLVSFFCALLCQTLINLFVPNLSLTLQIALYADELVFGGYRSLFVVLMVISFAMLFSKCKVPYNYVIEFIGKNTLGIYLFQDIVFKLLTLYLPCIKGTGFLYPLLTMFICIVICIVFNMTKYCRFLIHV